MEYKRYSEAFKLTVVREIAEGGERYIGVRTSATTKPLGRRRMGVRSVAVLGAFLCHRRSHMNVVLVVV